jgi:hypothetical protein
MGRKQKKYHYIYKTTCGVNGKYYIGMHSTDNLEDDYLGSGKRLWYSINYHGRDNHTKEILEFCENREQLKKREEEIVNEQLINEELCMNLKTGGQGGITDEDHKLKLHEGASRYQKEKWKDRSHVNKMVELAVEGVKKGHKLGNYRYDTFTNRKHTEETKKKMSEKAKQRKGEKNSQYGTCWITKDGENKKIKKDLLSNYENDGWVKGRK